MSANVVGLASEPVVRIAGHDTLAVTANGCRCLPGLLGCNPLKTHGRRAQRVSRICGAENAPPLPSYPTMFSSRNRTLIHLTKVIAWVQSDAQETAETVRLGVYAHDCVYSRDRSA